MFYRIPEGRVALSRITLLFTFCSPDMWGGGHGRQTCRAQPIEIIEESSSFAEAPAQRAARRENDPGSVQIGERHPDKFNSICASNSDLAVTFELLANMAEGSARVAFRQHGPAL
jgi:hypothetical protein